MSLTPIEMPAFVATRKPVSLRASSTGMEASRPQCLYVFRMRSPSCPFFTVKLTKPISAGQIVLKRMRPTVVTMVRAALSP